MKPVVIPLHTTGLVSLPIPDLCRTGEWEVRRLAYPVGLFCYQLGSKESWVVGALGNDEKDLFP